MAHSCGIVAINTQALGLATSSKVRGPIAGSAVQVTLEPSRRENSTDKVNLSGLTKPTTKGNIVEVTCMEKASCKR